MQFAILLPVLNKIVRMLLNSAYTKGGINTLQELLEIYARFLYRNTSSFKYGLQLQLPIFNQNFLNTPTMQTPTIKLQGQFLLKGAICNPFTSLE